MPPTQSRTRDRRGHGRCISRFDVHIDDRCASGLDCGDSRFEGGDQVLTSRNRPERLRPLGTRQPGNVDVRVGDALADPLVFDGPAALPSHTLLMHFVVVEGTVVGDDDQEGNAVVHSRPKRGCAHQEIAVTANTDGYAAATAQGEGGADRDAGSGADAASAVLPDEVERVPERPQSAVPGQGKME